jgi:hypothetical protein
LLQDKDLPLKISALNGITVLETMISLSPSGLSEEINLSGNVPGMYLICIKSEGNILFKKLILY